MSEVKIREGHRSIAVKCVKEIELLKETDLNIHEIEAKIQGLKVIFDKIIQFDESIQLTISDDDELIKDMEESENRNAQIRKCIITVEKTI